MWRYPSVKVYTELYGPNWIFLLIISQKPISTLVTSSTHSLEDRKQKSPEETRKKKNLIKLNLDQGASEL